MAARLIRAALAALLALTILLVGGVGLALLAFHPNAFKSALISAVQQRYQRRLQLPGTLRLRLFPPFTLQTGPMRLSATDGHTPFAQASDMLLHLDPLALLRRRVVIDGVELESPRLELRRDASGRWNFADLLAMPAGAAFTLQLHDLGIHDGDIALSDARDDFEGRLGDVYGHASGIGRAGWHGLSLRGEAVLPEPSSDTRFNLRGQLHVDPDGGGTLRNLVLRCDGSMLDGAHVLGDLHADVHWMAEPSSDLRVLDLRLRAQGRLHDGRPVQFELAEPLLEWSRSSVRAAALRANALVGAAPHTLRIGLRGSPLDGAPGALRVAMLRLALRRAPPRPLDLHLQLAAHVNLAARSAVLDTVDLRGAWGIPTRRWQAQGQGSYTPAHGLQARLQADNGAQIDARHGADGWALRLQAKDLDLGRQSATAGWHSIGALLRLLPNAQASVQADTLRWGSVQLGSVRARLHDDDHTLSLDDLQAQAWQGSLQARARLGLDVHHAWLQASLRHVSLARMLDAFYGDSPIDGRADLQTEVSWQQAGGGGLRANSGDASLQVRDGHLRGIDLRTMAGAPGVAGAASAFVQLDAAAAIAQGAAQLRELRLHTVNGDWRGGGSLGLDSDSLQLRLERLAAPSGGASAPGLRVAGTLAHPIYTWQAAAHASAPAPQGPPRYSPK